MRPADRITDAMLARAAMVNDLTQALSTVMGKVGITDRTMARMVFDGEREQSWTAAGYHARLAMMHHWRAAEQITMLYG